MRGLFSAFHDWAKSDGGPRGPNLEFSVLKWIFLFAAIGVLLGLRFPDPLVRARNFIAEEGAVYFQGAYNLPFWQCLFTPYAGYFNVGTRLLSKTCTIVPYRLLPFTYGLVSLLCAAGILAFFYLPHFRYLVPRDRQRFVICLSLCAAPDADPLLRLDSIHFYMVLFVALVSVMNLPRSRAGRFVIVALTCLCMWSSPVAFVVLPVFCYRAVRPNRAMGERVLWSVIALSAIGFFLTVKLVCKTRFHIHASSILGVYWHSFAYRVAGAGLTGEKLAGWLAKSFGWNGLLPLLLLVVFLAIFGLFMEPWKEEIVFPKLALLWTLCAAVSLLALRPWGAAFVKYKPGFPYWTDDRYFYPAVLILFIYLGVLWSRLRGRGMVALNLLLAGWCCYLFIWGYTFHPWTDWGPPFANYCRQIRTAEKEAAADGKIHELFIPLAPAPWFATLEVGKKPEGTAGRQAVVPCRLRLSDYLGVDDKGAKHGGLRHSSWLGTFDDSHYPWINTKRYGWMYCLRPDKAGIWFWSKSQGSFWATPLFFPKVFSKRKGKWLILPLDKSSLRKHFDSTQAPHKPPPVGRTDSRHDL